MKNLKKLAVIALSVASVGMATATSAQASNFFGSSNIAGVQSNFAATQSQLRSQIAVDVNAGQLDPNLANGLVSQLDQINAQTQADLMSGNFNGFEVNQLTAMLDSVSNQLNNDLGSGYSPYATAAFVPEFDYAAPIVEPAYTTPVYGSPVGFAPTGRGFDRQGSGMVNRMANRGNERQFANAPNQFNRGSAPVANFNRPVENRAAMAPQRAAQPAGNVTRTAMEHRSEGRRG